MPPANVRSQQNGEPHSGIPQDELLPGTVSASRHSDDLAMFNEAWVALAMLCVLIGVLTRQSGLSLIGVLLLTVLPVARLWNHFALRRVFYARRLEPRRAFIGETVALTLTVENRKPLPLGWLIVEDEWPDNLHLVEKEQDLHPLSSGRQVLKNTLSLRWYERVRLHYRIRCEQRGFFQLGPARMTAGDIFGLFKQRYLFSDIHWLIVYPQVWPIDQLGLPPKNPFGDIRSHERIFEDPARTVGVRDHQMGDGFRRIHWKATARRQQLQARVYEPSNSFTLMLLLNVATLERSWMGTIPDLLERCISVAASVSSYAVEQKWLTGLIANGAVPHSDQPIKVLPGRSPQQLTRILEALAAVRPVATMEIEQLLLRESPHLPWGATLVVITGIVTQELANTLLRLHRAGRRLVLISLAKTPPDPLLGEQILTYHLPDAAATYRPLQTAAVQQLDDRFRRNGVLAQWMPRVDHQEAG